MEKGKGENHGNAAADCLGRYGEGLRNFGNHGIPRVHRPSGFPVALHLSCAAVFLPVRVPVSGGETPGTLSQGKGTPDDRAVFCSGAADYPGRSGNERPRSGILEPDTGAGGSGVDPEKDLAHLVSGLPVSAGDHRVYSDSIDQKRYAAGPRGSGAGGAGRCLCPGRRTAASLESGCLLFGAALFHGRVSAEKVGRENGCVSYRLEKLGAFCPAGGGESGLWLGKHPWRGAGAQCLRKSVWAPPAVLPFRVLRHWGGGAGSKTNDGCPGQLFGQKQSCFFCLAPDTGDYGHLLLLPPFGHSHGALPLRGRNAGGEGSGAVPDSDRSDHSQ